MHYIFVFRSRNQSMRFYESLKREGVYAKLISTPRAVSVGCGLSVQIAPASLASARNIFSYSSYDTYLGLFQLSGNAVKRI